MRAFADAFPHFPSLDQNSIANVDNQHFEIVQATLAQLTWYHHITLLDKVKDAGVREFYIRKAIENGWSRDVMVHHIERGLHKIQSSLSTNFNRTIAPDDSELITELENRLENELKKNTGVKGIRSLKRGKRKN